MIAWSPAASVGSSYTASHVFGTLALSWAKIHCVSCGIYMIASVDALNVRPLLSFRSTPVKFKVSVLWFSISNLTRSHLPAVTFGLMYALSDLSVLPSSFTSRNFHRTSPTFVSSPTFGKAATVGATVGSGVAVGASVGAGAWVGAGTSVGGTADDGDVRHDRRRRRCCLVHDGRRGRSHCDTTTGRRRLRTAIDCRPHRCAQRNKQEDGQTAATAHKHLAAKPPTPDLANALHADSPLVTVDVEPVANLYRTCCDAGCHRRGVWCKIDFERNYQAT